MEILILILFALPYVIGLGYTIREVYREHNFNHHFHTTIREDS